MANQNKENLVQFGKVAIFGISAFAALIAFAGILNGVVANGLESFYGWVGGFNLCVEGVLFYAWYKRLFKKEEKKEDK